MISEKTEIAKLCNEYFAKVADKVELIGERDDGKNFENHPSIKAIRQCKIDTNLPVRFEFYYTNEVQVKQLLSAINVRKSCGYNMLSPKFIKESRDAIAVPIANILNASVNQSCYPSAWKSGQLTPIQKKDDEFNKVNYRPVTVLPVLNSIYEILLATQMDEFCESVLSNYISSYCKCYS